MIPDHEILEDLFFIERGYLNGNHFVYRSNSPPTESFIIYDECSSPGADDYIIDIDNRPCFRYLVGIGFFELMPQYLGVPLTHISFSTWIYLRTFPGTNLIFRGAASRRNVPARANSMQEIAKANR